MLAPDVRRHLGEDARALVRRRVVHAAPEVRVVLGRTVEWVWSMRIASSCGFHPGCARCRLAGAGSGSSPRQAVPAGPARSSGHVRCGARGGARRPETARPGRARGSSAAASGLLLEDAELSAFSLLTRTQSIDCFSGLDALPFLIVLVGLLDGHPRDQRGGLQDGRDHLVLLDRRDRVGAAVEADDLDLLGQARDFSAATAPSAIVSLPAMTPSMLRLRWRIVSILVNASCWSQLALCLATFFRSGYCERTSL